MKYGQRETQDSTKQHSKNVVQISGSARKTNNMIHRVGLFSGSFDPIHKGHIAFALQAIEKANLDKVYFLPERKPRGKPEITHLVHRLEMIKLATRAHPKLSYLALDGNNFTPNTTLPRIRKKFPKDNLVMLMGSDLFESMHTWPKVENLLREVGLVIGARGNYEVTESLATAHNLPKQPRELTIIDSVERNISSGQVRDQLANNQQTPGILKSVSDYAKKHWLYIKIAER